MIFVHWRFKESVSLLYEKCEYYSNTEIILHFNRGSVRIVVKKLLKTNCTPSTYLWSSYVVHDRQQNTNLSTDFLKIIITEIVILYCNLMMKLNDH